MILELSYIQITKPGHITISGSKSETNRLLLLQALFPEIEIKNISDAEDSVLMKKALESQENIIDIDHAGTAMRFLTAYFSIQQGREIILTGSTRMKERPVKILVDALRKLGTDIEYIENEGFPPLKIKGKRLTENKISISAEVSSQYISALMLIAPKLENGLEITLEGNITSRPYLEMTLALLNQIGIETSFIKNVIKINSKLKTQNSKLIVESDWSSASYFYSIVALSETGTAITLSSFKENSLQGDKALVEIYKNFGVSTFFSENSIVLTKSLIQPPQAGRGTKSLILNLSDCPDLAQTIAVTCFGLGIDCHLTGLHTLKIKETDRLQALKNELEKFGAVVSITHNSLTLNPCSSPWGSPGSYQKRGTCISTYQDHRMAMAFAPLALKTNIIIEDAEVVSKSYPKFWEDLKNIGFQVNEI